MRKSFLTLTLAIASSVWMTSMSQINSLCDEWNVLEHFMDGGPEYESFKTLHYRLTSDTMVCIMSNLSRITYTKELCVKVPTLTSTLCRLIAHMSICFMPSMPKQEINWIIYGSVPMKIRLSSSIVRQLLILNLLHRENLS